MMNEKDIHIHLTSSYKQEIEKNAKKELVDKLLPWYMEIITGLKGVKIPYNIIIKIDSFKEKLEEMKNG